MNLKKFIVIGIIISSISFFASCSKENKEPETNKNQNTTINSNTQEQMRRYSH